MTPASTETAHVRTSHPGRPVAADMEASARAFAAADEEHVRAAIDSVRWERRGVLQRLVRVPR